MSPQIPIIQLQQLSTHNHSCHLYPQLLPHSYIIWKQTLDLKVWPVGSWGSGEAVPMTLLGKLQGQIHFYYNTKTLFTLVIALTLALMVPKQLVKPLVPWHGSRWHGNTYSSLPLTRIEINPSCI